MKIAYLASKFPNYGETFVVNEVDAHHRAGVDILTLSCTRACERIPVSTLASEWEKRTVRPAGAVGQVWAVVFEMVTHPGAMLHNVAWLLGLLLIDFVEFLKGAKEFCTAASLASACRRHGTELIHVHFASRSLTAGLMLGRLTGTPVSCTVHAFELWLRGGRNLRYRLRHCRFIATESRYHVDYIRQKCGPEIANQCHVVRNGIDLSRFHASQSAPVPGRILLVSRLTEQKGHRYLVEAAPLNRRHVVFECILVGQGSDFKRIEKQIKQLDLVDTVRLVGSVANDMLQPYLNTAAVFALPAVVTSKGDRDGIPLALVEAMAYGIPVVSTDVAGIPELLRGGDAGCMVPQRDSEALADTLQRLLSDEDLVARLAVAGRHVVENEYDIRKTTHQLRRLFAQTTQV